MLMASERVLGHCNASMPVNVAYDASPYGIGTIISQKMEEQAARPTAFVSRSLTSADCKYAQFDREALSLVCGVIPLSLRETIYLVTDHQLV